MALIDDALAEAQRGNTIADSGVALIRKLVELSGGDPVKMQALIAQLDANHDKLEAAILENTPQEPPPAP